MVIFTENKYSSACPSCRSQRADRFVRGHVCALRFKWWSHREWAADQEWAISSHPFNPAALCNAQRERRGRAGERVLRSRSHQQRDEKESVWAAGAQRGYILSPCTKPFPVNFHNSVHARALNILAQLHPVHIHIYQSICDVKGVKGRKWNLRECTNSTPSIASLTPNFK